MRMHAHIRFGLPTFTNWTFTIPVGCSEIEPSFCRWKTPVDFPIRDPNGEVSTPESGKSTAGTEAHASSHTYVNHLIVGCTRS